MAGFEKAKRRLVVGTLAATGLTWLIFGDEIKSGFDKFGKPDDSSVSSSESAFSAALHTEVSQAMQTGVFNTASFKTTKKSFLLYSGSIRDGALTTLAEAGVTEPTPQQSADANCALAAATFAGTSEALTPDMRAAYTEGRFDAAAELCLSKVVEFAESDSFGKPGKPAGIVFPVGLVNK